MDVRLGTGAIATTGRDGVARFAELTPGPVGVVAGGRPARTIRELRWAAGTDIATLIARGPWELPASEGGRARVRVEPGVTTSTVILLPDHGTVEGVVLDQAGRPVSGARIFASGDPAGVRAFDTGVRSAADGSFRWVLSSSAMSIHAAVRGAAPSDRELVSVDVTTPLELRVGGRVGEIVGVVSDSRGQPCPGAEVWFEPRELRGERRPPRTDFPRLPALHHAVSDRSGDFRLRDVPVGQGVLRVRAPEHARWNGVIEVAAATTRRVACALGPGARVEGVVTDDRGAPVVGAVVTMVGSGAFDVRVRTGSRGEFTLGELPGRVRLRAEATGYRAASRRMRLKPGRAAVWNPVLTESAQPQAASEPPVEASQRIVPVELSLRPVGNLLSWDVHAHVFGVDGRSIGHGRVRERAHAVDLPPLTQGQYVVRLGGDDTIWTEHQLDLRAGESYAGEVELRRGMACRLTFTSGESHDAAGVRIELCDEWGDALTEFGLSPAQVRAGIGCGIPAGEWRCIVRSTGDTARETRIRVTPRLRRFELRLP